MGFFYGSLSHRQKCWILPMNNKKTGGEINQKMTTIRLWGIYHVHGLISLTRPGNDNWSRTPFKCILHYTIYNSYSSNGWKIVKIVAILNAQYIHSNFWRCKKGYRSVIFLLNSLCKVVQTHQWVFHAWFGFTLWRYNCWHNIQREKGEFLFRYVNQLPKFKWGGRFNKRALYFSAALPFSLCLHCLYTAYMQLVCI